MKGWNLSNNNNNKKKKKKIKNHNNFEVKFIKKRKYKKNINKGPERNKSKPEYYITELNV